MILLLTPSFIFSQAVEEILKGNFEVPLQAIKTLEEGEAFLRQGAITLLIIDGNFKQSAFLKDISCPLLILIDENEHFDFKDMKKGVQVLKKPFRLEALLQFLKVGLMQAANVLKAVQIGDFLFEPTRRLLVKENQNLPLTEKESQILIFLAQAKGELVTREQLLKELWRYHQDVETHTLETHIYRLRQKIEKDPITPQILKTQEGGYSLEVNKF